MKKYLLSVLVLAFAVSMSAQNLITVQLSSNLGYNDEEIWLLEDATEYTAAADMDDSQKIETITDANTNVLLYALTGFADFDHAWMLATDDLDGTQLGFVTNAVETDYKLTFTYADDGYYLLDKYLGTTTAIETDGVYPFEAPAGARIDNRFEIRKIATVPGMTLTAHEDPENAGDFYCTFFHSGRDFKLPAGVEAYVATVSLEALNLVKVADGGQVIPKNVAYILKANAASIELANADAAPVAISASNDLLGKDYEAEVPAHCYVFSGHTTDNEVIGIGFYEYEGAKLGANKAYVILDPGSSPAPRRLPFVFAGTTDIENTNAEFKSIKTIENGALIIEKNGVRYNAMGQIVK